MFLNEKPGDSLDLDEGGREDRRTINSRRRPASSATARRDLGDGQTTDYDDWTKQIWPSANRSGRIGSRRCHRCCYRCGALPERHIIPRNLRLGVYHGGRRPLDIYYRIHEGINGLPMPDRRPLMTDDEKQSVQKRSRTPRTAKAKKHAGIPAGRRRFGRASQNQAAQESRICRQDRRSGAGKDRSAGGFGIWWISMLSLALSARRRNGRRLHAEPTPPRLDLPTR